MHGLFRNAIFCQFALTVYPIKLLLQSTTKIHQHRWTSNFKTYLVTYALHDIPAILRSVLFSCDKNYCKTIRLYSPLMLAVDVCRAWPYFYSCGLFSSYSCSQTLRCVRFWTFGNHRCLLTSLKLRASKWCTCKMIQMRLSLLRKEHNDLYLVSSLLVLCLCFSYASKIISIACLAI